MDRRSVVIALLVLSTIVVYRSASNLEFLRWDDDGYVSQNRQVRAGLTRQGVSWAFTTGEQANWHPVTWLSHMLDCELFGAHRSGLHHVVNLLLHVVNTVLIFVLFERMTANFWPSAFVAGQAA